MTCSREPSAKSTPSRGSREIPPRPGSGCSAEKPNAALLAIQIVFTLRCNLHCGNCLTGGDLFQADVDITPETLLSFCEETEELRQRWRYVQVFGGEPGLNPDFDRCCLALWNYTERWGSSVGVFTNGERLDLYEHVPSNWKLWNSYKASRTAHHSLVYMAPADDEKLRHSDFSSGCKWLRLRCCSLAPTGLYYPCTAGGMIDRVFNLGVGLPSLKALLGADWSAIFRVLCPHCGLFSATKPSDQTQLSRSWAMQHESWAARRRP